MPSSRIYFAEKFTIFLVILILLTGYILFYTDIYKFEAYVQEDGIVEWLTVVGLMAGCFICLYRFVKLYRYRNWWFLTVVMLLAMMLFFVAGEEISWGQRIFGIKSPEFFVEENSQHEMNFHNLIIHGVKINKLIFSFGLIVALSFYLVVMQLLYYKYDKIKKLIDSSGVPIPRLYQIISFILLFVFTSLLHHEKNSELLECGAAMLFFLIILNPKNLSAFNHSIQINQ
jgi:uncharacterized BrkB/YihY/UPF0761 family membrane protein